MGESNDQPGQPTSANDSGGMWPPAISLTDLATALGLDEDALIERIGDALLRRKETDGVR